MFRIFNITISKNTAHCLFIAFLAVVAVIGVGLNLSYRPQLPHAPANAVYFWKTTFDPDSAEINFLHNHNIGRIYLRMFDIVADCDAPAPEEPVIPNATLRFPKVFNETFWASDPILANADYIPTIYITLPAMHAMAGNEELWAEKIVERVTNMVSYNFIPNVNEIQLDCDWTPSTEQAFFALCSAIDRIISRYTPSWKLSSTIRLHQLSGQLPPVDFGVLMIYNTGDFSDPDARNSIIDIDDISPYLRNLSSYRLPLDVAYPVYGWQLLFRNRSFAGLIRDIDTSDPDEFEQTGPNTHRALCDIVSGNTVIHKGDMIRTEKAEYPALRDIKEIIDRRISSPNHSSVIYHLDSKSLSSFSINEIDSIYTCRR